MERCAYACLLIVSLQVFLVVFIMRLQENEILMLIIQWLRRLPSANGIVIVKRTVTNADTTLGAEAEAYALWREVSLRNLPRPDGFQIVDQDGRSKGVTRLLAEGEIAA